MHRAGTHDPARRAASPDSSRKLNGYRNALLRAPAASGALRLIPTRAGRALPDQLVGDGGASVEHVPSVAGAGDESGGV
jgi:hypothetical protein